ncbi:hypothetical protein [Ferrimonas lipolytica]|uniref:Lipoprotein n=1 Tax=Ferrimonas lipolytica TaxID=2724191 RepID=A0A6H1UD00_9GAMM|nr:hypothetical protein [Ferrimonas lipolytica]QIZ75682.1 hypothetical protein HER31_01445 [Ferrimonas lipolytica]
MRAAIPFMLLLLSGCTSMPITTMYKLVTLEPLELDPGQLQVAVRTDNNVVIGDNGVMMHWGYVSEDNSLTLDENYPVIVDRGTRPSSVLLDGIGNSEQLVIFSLRPEDTKSMRLFQSQVLAHQQQGGEGSGSFGLKFEQFCFIETPLAPIDTDMFLQTDSDEGFFVFVEDIDLLEPDCDRCEIKEVPLCDSSSAEGSAGS